MAIKFKDRNVLLVDGCIVRRTTRREIVTMAREAGARVVHLASYSPPITHAHIYGIDLASLTTGILLPLQNILGQTASYINLWMI